MSSYIRYEIEIEVPAAAITVEMETNTPQEALRDLLDDTEFSFSPDDVDRWRGGPAAGPSYLIFTAYGEESDFSRAHEERHAEVVEAVRKKIPAANVRTKWLSLDFVQWDDMFDTADEESDDEDRSKEDRG